MDKVLVHGGVFACFLFQFVGNIVPWPFLSFVYVLVTPQAATKRRHRNANNSREFCFCKQILMRNHMLSMQSTFLNEENYE